MNSSSHKWAFSDGWTWVPGWKVVMKTLMMCRECFVIFKFPAWSSFVAVFSYESTSLERWRLSFQLYAWCNLPKWQKQLDKSFRVLYLYSIRLYQLLQIGFQVLRNKLTFCPHRFRYVDYLGQPYDGKCTFFGGKPGIQLYFRIRLMAPDEVLFVLLPTNLRIMSPQRCRRLLAGSSSSVLAVAGAGVSDTKYSRSK